MASQQQCTIQTVPALSGEEGRDDGVKGATSRVTSKTGIPHRQICAEPCRSITLATNASQLDIITNQLGESVSVVTEPKRRDTFPAIALAASYLSLEKKCSDDEVVVIMPCDPYTELGYFKTIGKMVKCVEQNVADLVFMGIQPTYPSAKYGYVVPTSQVSMGFRWVQGLRRNQM